MLQRVGIAQALVHDPSVVFLDEPMSGLDPIGRKEIRDLILRLRAEGKTVFMNTHILSDVEMVCDRVAIIVRRTHPLRGRDPATSCEAGERAGRRASLAGLSPDVAARSSRSASARGCAGVGERIELRVAEKQVNEVLRAALAAGARVVSVTPHRASLEAIFLSAVEEDRVSWKAPRRMLVLRLRRSPATPCARRSAASCSTCCSSSRCC